MIKATSSHLKIDEAVIFFQALLSNSAWVFAGLPGCHSGHRPLASHLRASLPRVPSQRGAANSTQPQAHSSGRFYAALEQLLQHNTTTAHQQRPHSIPATLFLCSPPTFAPASLPSKFYAYFFQIIQPTLPLPQTPLFLLAPSNDPSQALAHSYLSPCPGGFPGSDVPPALVSRGAFIFLLTPEGPPWPLRG